MRATWTNYKKGYEAVVRCLDDLENGQVHHGKNGDIAPRQDNIEYFRWLKYEYKHLMALEAQKKDKAVLSALLIIFFCALIFYLWTL